MAVWIESGDCTGCRLCVKACPYGAVEVEDGKASLNDRCTSCGACIAACRHSCIRTDASAEAPDLSAWSGVLVFCEQRDGVLNPAALEMMGAGARLAAASGQPLEAVIAGSGVRPAAETISDYGPSAVHVLDHPGLADYRTMPYASALADLIQSRKPAVVLFCATHVGRDLAPRISRRLGVGLTADCTGLEIEAGTGHLRQTRPAFGGNVIATILSRTTRPQMATVRPGVMEPATKAARAACEIRAAEPVLGPRDLLALVVEKVRTRRAGRDIRDARVIVAGGRGVGSAEGFRALERLASLLGGEVAGSRIAVEKGWIPQQNQVGQTGRTVRPDVYVACGISGAVQHAAGMQNSRFIVAVNKDPSAPIFGMADMGIVGDLHRIVPEIARQFA